MAGRPTRVLDVLAAPDGAVVERRWIDTKTRRALRTERYDISGKPWRRVEMTQVEFSPAVSEGEFAPSIADGTRILDTNHPAFRKRRKPRPEAEAAARQVHLAVQARDFVLEAATKRSDFSGGTTGASGTTHLTYTNGSAAISVFVTAMNKNGAAQGATGPQTAHICKFGSAAKKRYHGFEGCVRLETRSVSIAKRSVHAARGVDAGNAHAKCGRVDAKPRPLDRGRADARTRFADRGRHARLGFSAK